MVLLGVHEVFIVIRDTRYPEQSGMNPHLGAADYELMWDIRLLVCVPVMASAHEATVGPAALCSVACVCSGS